MAVVHFTGTCAYCRAPFTFSGFNCDDPRARKLCERCRCKDGFKDVAPDLANHYNRLIEADKKKFGSERTRE
jgi:hypothetical protein